MKTMTQLASCLLVLAITPATFAQSATASPASEGSTAKAVVSEENAAKPFTVELAKGKLTLTAPRTWKKVQPRSRILEAELKVPAVTAAAQPAAGSAKKATAPQHARLTIMRAGGSLPDNVARWENQFAQANGSATKADVTDQKIGDTPVKFVDITGTFSERMGGGPFAGGKTVTRENYRMMAAIVQTQEIGNYFFKFIGPKATVDANAEAFKKMIGSAQIK